MMTFSEHPGNLPEAKPKACAEALLKTEVSKVARSSPTADAEKSILVLA